MPVNMVRSPHEEKMWQQAKAAAKREGHAKDWAYINGVFQRMKSHVGGAKGTDAYRKQMHRNKQGRLVLKRSSVAKSFRTTDLHAHGGVPTDRVYDYLHENYPARVLTWVKRAEWHFQPKVRLSDIQMDRRPGGRNPDKVKAIADAVKKREPMEPVVLVDTGDGKYRIADGYHRTLAHKHAGEHTIRAVVGMGVPEHGPWERAMHEAKLNKSQVRKTRETEAGVAMNPQGPVKMQDDMITEQGVIAPEYRPMESTTDRPEPGMLRVYDKHGRKTNRVQNPQSSAKPMVLSRRNVPSARLVLRKAQALPAGQHWITIHPHGVGANANGEEVKGRHVLIDGDGRIIGGALPKSAHGKHITSWWKGQKTPEPKLHEHLRGHGVAFTHHESGTLTTGHGYQTGPNKWGRPEALPGHVGRALTRKEVLAMLGKAPVHKSQARDPRGLFIRTQGSAHRLKGANPNPRKRMKGNRPRPSALPHEAGNPLGSPMQESSMQTLGAITQSQRRDAHPDWGFDPAANLPGNTKAPKPVGKPGIFVYKSDRQIADALHDYAALIDDGKSPSVALHQVSARYPWAQEFDTTRGRDWWAAVRRANLPRPRAYTGLDTEVDSDHEDGMRPKKAVFWREDLANLGQGIMAPTGSGGAGR